MRAPVYAFGLVLVALVAHNVYWAVCNQSDKACDYTVCVGPRNAHAMALRNRHPVVKGRVAIAFALRDELAGKTLEIPPWLEESEWRFQKVSRINVELRDAPALLNTDLVDELKKKATSKHQWFKRKKGRRGWWREMYVLAVSPEDRYVVAETGRTLGPIFLLPRSQYLEVARAPKPVRKKSVRKKKRKAGSP